MLEDGDWDGAEEEGRVLGTRENFVLLGFMSASSSERKERSSWSAISSRLRGAEGEGVDIEDWNCGEGSGFDEALFSVSAEELEDDQSQPIVRVESLLLLLLLLLLISSSEAGRCDAKV